MKTLSLLVASASSLALMAAEGSSGSGSGQPDDLLTSDATPHPLSSDAVSPAEPQPDPAINPVGPAEGVAPNPPVNEAEAAAAAERADAEAAAPAKDREKEQAAGGKSGKSGKTVKKAAAAAEALKTEAGKPAGASDPLSPRAYMVWAQPGHETIGLGQIVAVPTVNADVLRGAGRARFASEAEVVAAREAVAGGNVRAILDLDGI